jgi:hypothetical protein
MTLNQFNVIIVRFSFKSIAQMYVWREGLVHLSIKEVENEFITCLIFSLGRRGHLYTTGNTFFHAKGWNRAR